MQSYEKGHKERNMWMEFAMDNGQIKLPGSAVFLYFLKEVFQNKCKAYWTVASGCIGSS